MEDKSKMQESIVVAGIACRFPDSKNVNEFWDYLCKKGDKTKSKGGGFFALLTGKNQSNNPNRFDASFFDMSPEDVKQMSPDLRTILELSYESIIDSGSHPQELKGSNIGVYVSSSSNALTKLQSHLQDRSSDGKNTTESGRETLVKKITDYFDFKGPKYCQDGDSSSPLLAIHQAVMDIRNGNCEGAVIGARTNLRKSKTSDAEDVDQQKKSIVSAGNSRTDAIMAVYITKQSLCRRAYAHFVNSGTNITGANGGTTNSNGPTEQELIQQVCSGGCISVDDVEYLENHCSASKTDDPQVSRIVQLFSQNRSTDKPLLFGSTTFEVAQKKVSSELASFIKIMLICNNDVIPPSHYLNPDDLQTLENTVKIVEDTTKFNGGYVAMNSSRPDGSVVAVIINPFCSAAEMIQNEMPKLVVCSGRNMNGLRESIKYVSNNKEKGFFYTLSNPVANAPVQRMPYRGYQLNRTREIKKIESANDRPIWYIFAGVGSQWPGLAKDMMNLPRFKESILRSHETLDKVDPEFNLLNLLLDSRKDTFNSVIKTFVGIACVQVALINCLKDLGVTPDGYFGHSVGEVACAYVDGALTEEQAVLVAYWRGRSIVDPGKIYGAMASVGMSWDEAGKRLPPGVVLGCNNSDENVTISGDQEPVHKCMQELEDEGFYVSEIDTSGAAYHSHQIAEIAPIMTKALDDLNLSRTLRSPSWISTSYAEELWDTEEAKWCDSKYLTNNLVSPVLFHEAASKVPSNAIAIEIAPHCLMQSTLKRNLHDDCEMLSLMNRKEEDNLHYFFTNVGKLYTAGVDVNLNKLYPSLTYPVGVGTPSLSPAVEWDHATKWDETSK